MELKGIALIMAILLITAGIVWIFATGNFNYSIVNINSQSGNFNSQILTWSGNSSVPAKLHINICYYAQTPNGTYCGALPSSSYVGGGTPFASYLINFEAGQYSKQGLINEQCTSSLQDVVTSSAGGPLQTEGTYPPQNAFHTYQYQNLIGQDSYGTVNTSEVGDLCSFTFPFIGSGSNGGAGSGGVSVTSSGYITVTGNATVPGYYPINQSFPLDVGYGGYYPTIFFVELTPLPQATTTTTVPPTTIPITNGTPTTISTISTTTISPSTTQTTTISANPTTTQTTTINPGQPPSCAGVAYTDDPGCLEILYPTDTPNAFTNFWNGIAGWFYLEGI